MPDRLPPPYEELAQDGQRYFKILGVSPNLIAMYEMLLEAAEIANTNPALRAAGIEIDRLIRQVQQRNEEAARVTAVESIALIRARINATRVRPPGTNSLLGAVLSKPVPSIVPGGGAVGIGDIEALNRGTLRPSGGAKVPFYWRAQEFGSDHLVGHALLGVFQPGEEAPSPEQRRQHPFFEVRGKGQGKRERMIIRNPIAERGFLREGGYLAYEFRRLQHKTIEASAIATMKGIEGLLPK